MRPHPDPVCSPFRDTLVAVVFAIVCLVGFAALAAMAGCAQSTETAQPTVSQNVPSAPTEQASATPTTIIIKIEPWNGPNPEGRGGRGEGPGAQAAAPMTVASAYAASTQEGTQTLTGPPATYTQTNNIWIDTSSTGSSGGTASGSASGTQTVSPSQTVSPTQEVKPAINVAFSPAVGTSPRVVLEQTAAADQGSATAAPIAADQSGDTLEAFLEAAAGNPVVQQFLELLESWRASRLPAKPEPPAAPVTTGAAP